MAEEVSRMGLGVAAVLLAVGVFVLVSVLRGNRPRAAASSEGRRASRLAAGGLAFAVLCIVLNAVLDVSIGRLHVMAALALVGLLAVVAGGVFAVIAIARRGERSTWVYAALPLSLLAFLWVVSELAFDVP